MRVISQSENENKFDEIVLELKEIFESRQAGGQKPNSGAQMLRTLKLSLRPDSRRRSEVRAQITRRFDLAWILGLFRKNHYEISDETMHAIVARWRRAKASVMARLAHAASSDAMAKLIEHLINFRTGTQPTSSTS